MDASAIVDGEKCALNEMIERSRMPTPTGNSWTAIMSHYNLPKPAKIDDVLSHVTLPPGWTVKKDEMDIHGRRCTIFDHKNNPVGSTFLKSTYYDCYGRCSFDEDRLKQLSIL